MKPTRKFPLLRIILGGFLLLIGMVVVWRISITSATRQQLGAIAARGEPVDAAALDRFYKAVPDAQNAALLWLKGVDAVAPAATNSIWSEVTFPRRGTIPDEGQLQLARDLISSNKQALAIFHRAAALKGSRYPVDFSRPLADLPHLREIKSAAQILRLEVLIAMTDHDTSRVVEAIDAMLGVGRSLETEPMILSQLVRYAVDIMAFKVLESAVSHHSLADKDLSRLSRGLAVADDSESLARAFLGERAFFVSQLSDLKGFVANATGDLEVEEPVSDKVFSGPLIRATGFFQRDMAFGVEALTASIACARLSDPQKFRSATNLVTAATRAKKGYYILSGLLLPAFEKAFARDANHCAYARVAQVALVIERYRHNNDGKLPRDLTSLVPGYIPEVPIDPFDGKPLRFKQTEKGYVVYSVGPDENDDGGAEKLPKAPKGAPEDTTFIVERTE